MRRILLDVDGVAADFVRGLELALDYEFSEDDLKKWDIMKTLSHDLYEEALDVLTDPGFWRRLPVMEGAQETVFRWDGLGYDISWVTSPWTSCESWESARRDWLEEHFQMRSNGHHYIPTSSKEKVVGDVFIDDKPKNVTVWMTAHPQGTPFIFDAPHNQTFDSAPRFTWERAAALV